MIGLNYRLFSNCIVSAGYTRYLIQDLQRGKIYPIDKILGDYLLANETFDFTVFDQDEREFYRSFLFERELIFECTGIPFGLFPKIDEHFESPSFVSIIEANYSFLFELDKSLFIDLIVQHLVIRIGTEMTNTWSNSQLDDFLDETAIEFCSVVLNYDQYNKLQDEFDLNRRISQILVTNSPVNRTTGIVTFLEEDDRTYAINRPTIAVYVEALQNNLYYNGRICFKSPQYYHFGDEILFTFKNSTELINQIDSQKSNPSFIWNIPNSKKPFCKDCEHKHLCSNKIDQSRQSKAEILEKGCDFNPYISRWKHEQGFIPISACGSLNEEGNFILDENKVKALNDIIWS